MSAESLARLWVEAVVAMGGRGAPWLSAPGDEAMSVSVGLSRRRTQVGEPFKMGRPF